MQKVILETERLLIREYTEGDFNGNGKIISELQNHRGIAVGRVEKVNYGKNFNQVYINSNRTLYPKSTFKIFDNGVEKCVLSAFDIKDLGAGKYLFTTTQKVEKGNSVNLIVDAVEEENALSVIKKKELSLNLTAIPSKPIEAEIVVNGKSFKVCGDVLAVAQKQPLTKRELEQNFSKSEYFEVKINNCEIGNSFVQKSKLNEFRRKVFECAYEHLTKCFKRNLKTVKVSVCDCVKEFNNFQTVENIEDKLQEKNIIYSPEIYELKDVLSLKEKCEKQGKKLYLDTPNFALKKDIELLKEIVQKASVGVVVNNYYALSFDCEKIIGGGLNVYNLVTASYLSLPIICAESSLFERVDFPFMTLRHCPIKSHVGGNCKNCKYTDGYEYVMDSGKALNLKRKKLSSCTFYLV